MNIKLILLAAAASILILGLAIWGGLTTYQLHTSQAELAATRSTLAATQSDLAQTKTDLASTKSDLDQTISTLDTTNSQLAVVKSELTTSNTALEKTTATLSKTQSDLYSVQGFLTQSQQTASALQTTLTQTQQKLTASQNTLTGLGIGIQLSKECYDVKLTENSSAKDPTLAQLKTFLKQDQTEMNTYITDVYDCSQFSRDVHNHAEAAGISAAEVQIFFKNELVGHALNAFLTTDYGLVYVDCTKAPDTFARVENGKVYRSMDINSVPPSSIRDDKWWDSLYSGYYYIPSSAGGQAVVTSISIFW